VRQTARMGLRDLLSRWTKSEDERAIERAREESTMTPYERDVDQEDFEGRKDDLYSFERGYPDTGASPTEAERLEED
jgi:hypothetical protein